MKTITQHIREHLLNTCGYYKAKKMPGIRSLVATERSPEFETFRRNRMVMGAFRYGLIERRSKAKGYRRVDYMRQKLELYTEDGNAEHLADIANFCEVEFMEENHPRFHWSAGDDTNHMEIACD